MTPDANAADAAEPIRDRVRRTSHTFRREDDNLWVETWFEDDAHLSEHYHPTLTEYWEILDGTAQVKLNGHTIELTPEDGPVLVAPNDRHELRNTSGRPLHARTKVIPAGRLQEFLTASGWAAREGLYNAQYADQHPRHGLASRLRANATATRRSRPRHHPRPNDSSCRSWRASPADPLTERPSSRPPWPCAESSFGGRCCACVAGAALDSFAQLRGSPGVEPADGFDRQHLLREGLREVR
jgi:mannose-6-phosphate isomerase-like protein (cupin superfamily)